MARFKKLNLDEFEYHLVRNSKEDIKKYNTSKEPESHSPRNVYPKRLYSNDADWDMLLPRLRKSLRRFNPKTMIGTVWPQPADIPISYWSPQGKQDAIKATKNIRPHFAPLSPQPVQVIYEKLPSSESIEELLQHSQDLKSEKLACIM